MNVNTEERDKEEVCKMLKEAAEDESHAVIAYSNIIALMPTEHREHIKELDEVLVEENRHRNKIRVILSEMCRE